MERESLGRANDSGGKETEPYRYQEKRFFTEED